MKQIYETFRRFMSYYTSSNLRYVLIGCSSLYIHNKKGENAHQLANVCAFVNRVYIYIYRDNMSANNRLAAILIEHRY